MGVLLALLVAAGVFFCVSFVGVGLWVLYTHFTTADIPAGISHPKKLRVCHCIFLLLVAWGKIFEKLRICSMPGFVRFMHDLLPLKEDPDVMVTDLLFGTIPVKLYQPKASSCTLRPGVVLYHGGGGIIGSLKTHHKICCRLSKESDSVVLSVGYRMSPQSKFPTPVRDSIAATIHFLKSLETYKVDPARVVVCGDSAGGGIAAIVCQKLMDKPDLPKIRAQILLYTVIELLDLKLPSFQENQNVPLLTHDFIYYCWFCYLDISPSWKSVVMERGHLPAQVWEKYRKWLGSENIPERFKKKAYRQASPAPLNEGAYLETEHILDLMCSPLIAEDEVISRLPEACIVSCEYDILRDHSLLYKKRLEDLGVSVTWHHMEDGFHGVLNTLDMGCLQFPCSTRILNAMVRFLKGL
ncbi:arylacetamide deacetylase-like 3 [Rhinolophus ferrumequinum]|uniref:arylacetamide deacetylase-like 3 n=1 Tax=Rhinolophus ferrumequinum TaxID=59479 RepID=UPI00140F7FCE|nr:arylacetamide deacetylase-like 3 [Rhinolophus ferrumequinum]